MLKIYYKTLKKIFSKKQIKTKVTQTPLFIGRHCYIPIRMRIQVRSLESEFIGRSNHKFRTKLVSSFKMV